MTPLRPWILGALFGAACVVALPLSGLLPHSTGTLGMVSEGYRWLSTRQSVTLRSLTTLPPPDLEDPARLARAAGHYDFVCRDCHGAPGQGPERFALDLMPRPPVLAAAHRWRPPARTWLTLRDGVAHSAMPAWPARSRADEIWDMTAFLAALPGLSPEAYRSLAGDGSCTSCHDDRRAGVPKLSLQEPAYLEAALKAYRDGSRASGPMQAQAYGLTDARIAELAAGFGRGRSPDLPDQIPELIAEGDRTRGIPACLGCHRNDARPDYPRLAGQDRSYLENQLALFAMEDSPRGGPHAGIMAPVAAALTAQERAEIAAWFAALTPGPEGRKADD